MRKTETFRILFQLVKGCPDARENMSKEPVGSWMIPKCNKDGTFQELQCFDEKNGNECICVYKYGVMLPISIINENTTSCICPIVACERYLYRFLARSKVFSPLYESSMPLRFEHCRRRVVVT
ncbi:hypothetical protein AVEN_80932-1 [Araneus ventricosus]|uniref:Thyroglobulin type-1 domain-containing protein n=1 Tax=Araneus ventricosus TaxID=182803 RepID=A0A4Y2GQE6_ARAVE|nr:hypothetical protein AVEN_80932-1 [Araneus ventricosus]